jgi:hypothetical protein
VVHDPKANTNGKVGFAGTGFADEQNTSASCKRLVEAIGVTVGEIKRSALSFVIDHERLERTVAKPFGNATFPDAALPCR